jgi:hypothetical protein
LMVVSFPSALNLLGFASCAPARSRLRAPLSHRRIHPAEHRRKSFQFSFL